MMTNFKVGQKVRMTTDVYDDGSEGHHPPGYFAHQGEVLLVRKVDDGAFPVYVSHEHIKDNSFGVEVTEIEAAE
jgi:hypothetical protein